MDKDPRAGGPSFNRPTAAWCDEALLSDKGTNFTGATVSERDGESDGDGEFAFLDGARTVLLLLAVSLPRACRGAGAG